ncbi:hypothetical protein CNMCM5623_001469 [Aspergillus felis]|uniref:Uncharacterized protein n=1 Tax=Aspergillus felis TaxID=1287682 RepID=A0A8H6QZZ8_9EURO|nr:hypothetical protein CNMCM5623_001469 [Aspergillus felis]KAF7180981.1 hypothetical protein CNMCM7691_000110 [Aspergillus felis]
MAIRPAHQAHPPLLNSTTETTNAAGLIGESQALSTVNGSHAVLRKRSSFWLEAISRKRTVPWGNIDGFQVFRIVKEVDAVGDGIHVGVYGMRYR